MADPLLFSLVQDLEFQTGYRIKQVVATAAEILDAIQKSYPDKALDEGRRRLPRGLVQTPRAQSGVRRRRGRDVADAADRRRQSSSRSAGLKERSETAPIVDLVDLVVRSAIRSHASDVHIEPLEKGVLVRHRLDGLLKEVMDLPKWVHEGLIARLKIMGGMDIAEKRLPQDGRIRVDDR